MLGRIRRAYGVSPPKRHSGWPCRWCSSGAIFGCPRLRAKGPRRSAAHGGGEGFKFFEPLLNHEKFDTLERTGLIAVLIIAIIGLAYALMLRSQVLAAPQAPRRCRRSPMRSGGGECLPGCAVPQDWAADRHHHDRPVLHEVSGAGVCLRPRRGVPGRSPVQLDCRLCRHAAGHRRQPPRGHRRPQAATAKPCSSVIARVRWPACSPTAWACWAAHASS